MTSQELTIQHKKEHIVSKTVFHSAEPCYKPFTSCKWQQPTMLTSECTKWCHQESVVEKQAPQHAISETHCEQCEVQTKCAYNDLTSKRGDDDAGSIIYKQEPPENSFKKEKSDMQLFDACHNERPCTLPIGQVKEKDETTTKDQY